MNFETEFTIKEHHLDTFGHVNNAAYLSIFEEVRWEFSTINGYGLNEVHHYKKAPIILEINLRFKRELKPREKVRITMRKTRVGKKISEITQEIFNQKGELCTVAIFQMGFFDLVKRTLITPPIEWQKAMNPEDFTGESFRESAPSELNS